MKNKLKIREVCGEYALDILFEDMNVNTIYFNSQKKMPKQLSILSKLTIINPIMLRCAKWKKLSTANRKSLIP